MTDDVTSIDGSKDFVNFLGAEGWRLAFGPRKFGRFDLPGRINSQRSPFILPRRETGIVATKTAGNRGFQQENHVEKPTPAPASQRIDSCTKPPLKSG
jgi:hypothetical protein